MSTSTCPACGSRLVEVDNPVRREVRHPRGVECSGVVPALPEGLLDSIRFRKLPADVDLTAGVVFGRVEP